MFTGKPRHRKRRSQQKREYRLKVWMLTGTGVVLLATVGGLLARAYPRLEAQMSVTRAQQLLAKGDYAGAIANASEALSFSDSDLAASRVMADATAMGHSQSELSWAQRLADLEPTVENKLRLAETGLRCQNAPYPVSTGVLKDLEGKCSGNPVFHFLAGLLAKNLQQLDQAEAQFNAAVQLDPTNQTYSLYQATVQLRNPDPVVKKQARQQLETLGSNGNLGGEAYRALVAERVTAGDDAGARRYSDLLVASPQATLTDRLQNLEILHRLNSGGFNLRLQDTMNIVANNAGAVEELSAWMQQAGLVEENLAWLDKLPYGIRSEMDYKLAMARDYLQMGKWQAMLDLIAQDNWHNMDYLRLALISHAWAELGVPTVAQSDWGDAEMQAANHYEAMTNLLSLAEAWQLTDAQLNLRHRLMQLPPQ